MKVNVDKTKIVVFSKGRLPRNLIFNHNGTNIEIVKNFNYLGIYFSMYLFQNVIIAETPDLTAVQ
jgi:hypothetical protein